MDADQRVIARAQTYMRERGGTTIRRQDVNRAQADVGHILKIDKGKR